MWSTDNFVPMGKCLSSPYLIPAVDTDHLNFSYTSSSHKQTILDVSFIYMYDAFLSFPCPVPFCSSVILSPLKVSSLLLAFLWVSVKHLEKIFNLNRCCMNKDESKL